jgi:hypothetical protein
VDKGDVNHVVNNFVFCPPLLTSLLFKEAKDKSGLFGINHIRSIVSVNAKKIFFPLAAKQASPPKNALCAKAFIDFAKPILTFLQAAQNGTVTAYNFNVYKDPDGGEQLRLSALTTFGVQGNLKGGRGYKGKDKSVDDNLDGTEQNKDHASSYRDVSTSTPSSNTDTSALFTALELLTQNQAGMQQLALESTKSLHATSKSKNLFKNLPPQSQLIFKRASAEPHVQEVEPTAPFSKCVDIFNAAHRAKASFTLDAILKDSHKRGIFQVGNLTMVLVQGPKWNSQVEPTGLTGLAIFEDKKTRREPERRHQGSPLCKSR